jgi:YVTN family beta-propeller protein
VRRAGAVAALALPLATSGIAATPASAARGGYRVTHTIPVNLNPYAVAVDPAARTVYVTNNGRDNVSVIDEATNSVTAWVGADGPLEVAVDPTSHTAYVTRPFADAVAVIQPCR